MDIFKTIFPKGNYWFNVLAIIWWVSEMVWVYLIPGIITTFGESLTEYYHLPKSAIETIVSTWYIGEMYSIAGNLMMVFIVFIIVSTMVDAYYVLNDLSQTTEEIP